MAALDLSEEAARSLAASLPGDGHVGLGADLADVSRHDALVRAADDAVGPLVALVHLAAVLHRRHDIREVDEPDWDAQADVNLKATFFLNRAFAELLRTAGRAGAIVNFSSQGWWTGGFGGSVVYNATKGGIVTMTRGLARTYAAAGIRVNAVAPGLVDTPDDPRRPRARRPPGASSTRCRSGASRHRRRSHRQPSSSPRRTRRTSPGPP